MEGENNPNTTNSVVRKEGSIGPVIGTIIILAVILLGGLYFWGHRSDEQNLYNTDDGRVASSTDDTAAINNQSSADDVNSIQTDLNNTNTDVNTQLNAS